MRSRNLFGSVAVALLVSCGGTMPSGDCPQGCPVGYTCQSQTCVPSGGGGGCVPACQAGFTCQGTICVPTGGGGCSPACQSGFTCQGSTCVVNPTGSWVITVTNGVISEKKADGSSWDVPGGLPDAMVCLTIQGARRCTPARSDTLTPSWDYSFPAATATALQSGVGVEYLDEDLAANDTICSGTMAVDATSFASRTWGVRCQGTSSSFAATLSPR